MSASVTNTRGRAQNGVLAAVMRFATSSDTPAPVALLTSMYRILEASNG